MLGAAALAHYADFGHSAIYVLKTGQLIDRLGNTVSESCCSRWCVRWCRRRARSASRNSVITPARSRRGTVKGADRG